MAVIPARGGSKGIPRKNLAMVAGHPLIAYSIAGALAAERVHRVIVSTDDLEIADVARAYGAEVPFIRPAELATDDTPDLPVFDHALGWLAARAGDPPDILVHLRPTSPLRQVADIDRAVDLLRENPTADSVRSVCAPFQNPYKMWRLTDHGLLAPLLGAEVEEPYNLPHQKLPPVYWQTGYIDATRYRTIVTVRSMTGGAILPLVIGDDSWVDIDTRAMLEHADFLIRTGRVKVATPRRV
ncbi:MAG: acylneuraminate cytidylyltransferase family protein [Candidatus Rokubacteria bacterium]|nr:acylneuraminate cytidylyltransferase family protein [Candidatus Rokubacteria bacterium]